MEGLMRELLVKLGEDPDRPGLEKTPARAARALSEMTRGYSANPEDLLVGAVFEAASDGLVVCRDIQFVSLCEHHLLPFVGTALIAFAPGERHVGISKLVRVLQAYACRLQVQERLGQQVLDCMEKVLSPRGCLVYIRATHLCMVARGVRQENAVTETFHTSGIFRTDVDQVKTVLRGGR